MMVRFAVWVHRWEGLIMLPVVVALLFPTPVSSLALVVLPLLFLLRRLHRPDFLPATPFNLTLLLLLLALLLSFTVTFDITLSFPKIAGLLVGITLFFVADSYARRGPRYVAGIAGIFLLAGGSMALFGLFGVHWTGVAAPLDRLKTWLPGGLENAGSRGLVNPNELAGILDWLLPFAFGLWIGFWHERRRIPWLILLLPLAATAALLLATRSRAGILSAALALLLIFTIQSQGIRRIRGRRRLLMGVILTGAAITLIVILNATLKGAAQQAEVSLSWAGRTEIWTRAIYALRDFPLTGISMNGFRVVVHTLYPLFLISPEIDLGHAHNQLLQAGLDLGLMGMTAYLALWLTSGVLLWQSWQRAPATALPLRALILALCGALAGSWLFGLIDAISLGARPGFLWWLLLALVVAAHRESARHATETGPS